MQYFHRRRKCGAFFIRLFLALATILFILHYFDYQLLFYLFSRSLTEEELDNWYNFQGNDSKNPTPSIGLDCQRVLRGDDAKYTREMAMHRLVYSDPPTESILPMDCAEIRRRHHFSTRALSQTEQEFQIAFARIVNRDYRFLEAELATHYQPQNWYCFAVDAHADGLFISRMRALANCFPNIIVPKRAYLTDSEGKNISRAYLECMRELARPERKWHYLVTLNNHDVQVRTNEEVVQIFKWLGGANDIEYDIDEFGDRLWSKRIAKLERDHDWTFQSLGLLKNENENRQLNAQGRAKSLKIAKGYAEASLARHWVEFILHELDLTIFLARMDRVDYAADEFFLSTLAAADDLANAPGGFTRKCLDRRICVPYVTRYTVWYYGWFGKNYDKCYSGKIRHSICLLGLEDIVPTVRNSSALFVNKMWPEWDFGAILCWHQEMRWRTLGDPGLHRLSLFDSKFYRNWPQTNFYRQWLNNSGRVDLQSFDCGAGFDHYQSLDRN